MINCQSNSLKMGVGGGKLEKPEEFESKRVYKSPDFALEMKLHFDSDAD